MEVSLNCMQVFVRKRKEKGVLQLEAKIYLPKGATEKSLISSVSVSKSNQQMAVGFYFWTLQMLSGPAVLILSHGQLFTSPFHNHRN